MSAKDSKNNDDEHRASRRPRRERTEEQVQDNYDSNAPIRNEEPMGATGKPRRRRGGAEEAEADGKTGWMNSPNKRGGGSGGFEDDGDQQEK